MSCDAMAKYADLLLPPPVRLWFCSPRASLSLSADTHLNVAGNSCNRMYL
jgi:hypothetical protein